MDVDAVAIAICTAEGDNPSEYKHYRAAARAAIDALQLTDITARLAAFGKDCVTHGDMTPAGARMLLEILEDCPWVRVEEQP